MFARPGPLGRLARAVLLLKNKTTIRYLNTPWAKGPANFFLRSLGVVSKGGAKGEMNVLPPNKCATLKL